MLRQMMLSVFAVAVTGMTAGAADLPEPGALGKIFGEPAEVHSHGRAKAPPPTEDEDYVGPVFTYNPLADLPWRHGDNYYGSQYSYIYNGPYYGGPYASKGLRLPYACGLYGYC
jgi:hypothetical protein